MIYRLVIISQIAVVEGLGNYADESLVTASLVTALEAQLKERQKQYEYYRKKLLTFE